MGKKKGKTKTSFSESISAPDNSMNKSQLSVTDISFQENLEKTTKFKVLVCKYMEEKEKFYSWTKSCSWTNIAFIHPDIMVKLKLGDYVWLEGTETKSLFVAYPLKTVKKSTVVLRESMGLKHEELVVLNPLQGDGYEAKRIFITPSELNLGADVKEMLQRHMSNMFIWPGLKITLNYVGCKYQFEVTEVESSGTVKHKNCIPDLHDDSSFCETPESSMSNNRPKNCDSLAEAMVSMSLGDCEKLSSKETKDSESPFADFFVMSYKTEFVYCKDEAGNADGPPSFEHIGGYKEEIKIIEDYIDNFLNAAEREAIKPQMLLLMGPKKSGKTLILKAVLNKYSNCAQEIEGFHLLNKDVDEAVNELRRKFKPLNGKPSILILDQLNSIYPPNKKSIYYNIALPLQKLLEECDPKILLITSAHSESKQEMKWPDSFLVQKVQLSMPEMQERQEIIQKVLASLQHSLSSEEIKDCADFTEGMTSGEIVNVIKLDSAVYSMSKLKNQSSTEKEFPDPILTFEVVKAAIRNKKPSLVSSNIKSQKVNWADIGGMDDVKKMLNEEQMLFKASPEMKRAFDYKPMKGILLYGPPGCSKTMIAKALATEWNWNFISKKSSEILNMYVGESEKAVTRLFSEAKARAPCMIFLDEIDALAADRTNSCTASGVGNRVVNALLTEIDGFETLNNVMVIAATNRPDIIDRALLRSERIGRHVYVPLPDPQTRKEIFKISNRRRTLDKEVDFDILAEKTKGYTGAEIVNLCNEAAMILLLEDLDCDAPVFRMKHFEGALKVIPPRTSQDLIECYEQFSRDKRKT